MNERLKRYLTNDLENFFEKLPNKFLDTDEAFREVRKLNHYKGEIEAYFRLH